MRPLRALAEGATTLGLTLSPAQIEQFERYLTELVDWNRRANLTAIIQPLDIVRKHFLDSLSLLAACEFPAGSRVIDVGSGAGFPGLPVRLARSDLHLTLLEATRKKCDFLHHLTARLDLGDVAIVNARAEDAGRDPLHRERYRAALARAVADMAALMEYTLPFVEMGGWVAAQKSGDVKTEVEGAAEAIAVLGGHLRAIESIDVPGLSGPRAIVIVDKAAPTPEKYPRRSGMPAKRPIW